MTPGTKRTIILLDSNIVIYLRDPDFSDKIINQLNKARLGTCNIIIAEVLGFKEIEIVETRYFEDLFSTMNNFIFDEAVTRQVIELRRTMAIQLPDAIIAATAIINNLTLWTHNNDDFQYIPGLRWFDPLLGPSGRQKLG